MPSAGELKMARDARQRAEVRPAAGVLRPSAPDASHSRAACATRVSFPNPRFQAKIFSATILRSRKADIPKDTQYNADQVVWIMDIYDLLREKRAEILRTAAEHGAYNVRIFGSVARGEAADASDVDFLVEMEPGRSLLDLGGLLMDLQDLLGCSVDVVTERGLRKRIRDQVLKEAVAL